MDFVAWFRVNRLFIYYGFLLLVAFFLMDPSREQISLSIRFAYMLFCFAPVVVRPSLLPPTLVLFCGLSKYSFISVMPETDNIYLLITLAVVLYKQGVPYHSLRYFYFYGFFVIVSLLYQDYDEKFIQWGGMAILAASLISDKDDLQTCWLSFVVLSLFLSALFLTHMGKFMAEYGRQAEDLTRSNWINPNTFGSLISCGALMCVLYLMDHLSFERTRFLNVLCSVSLALCFITLVFNASRGAFFSFTISSVIAILLSKERVGTKISFVVVIILFVGWMFYNNVFDLLLYRMQNDNFETGGARTTIWAMKLDLFSHVESYHQYLFGIGREACSNLGRFISTHNDFITALIGYGIIGLLLFSYIIVYPLLKVNRQNFIVVFSTIILIIVECNVLEPFFRGNIVIIMLYFFVLNYALQIGNLVNEELEEDLIS